jgi:hypothetical protein
MSSRQTWLFSAVVVFVVLLVVDDFRFGDNSTWPDLHAVHHALRLGLVGLMLFVVLIAMVVRRKK